MSNSKMTRIAVTMTVLGGALAGPVAGAGASDAGIRHAIETHEAKIIADEGKLLTTIGEFKTSGNAAPLEAADQVVISDLRSLESKLAKQSASTAAVKAGKKKFDKGLLRIALAYQRLGKAFAEKSISQSAASAEAQKALKTVKAGRKELKAGVKLLNE